MALADDPKDLILHMFQREMYGRSDHECEVFPEGFSANELGGTTSVLFYGALRKKYFFSPEHLLVLDAERSHRIRWKEVVSCSSQHGSGDKTSTLLLVDGRQVRISMREIGSSWGSRVSQLYHLMIKHYGAKVTLGPPLLSVSEFFEQVSDDYSIAPNLYPHPGLRFFRDSLQNLQAHPDILDVRLIITDFDEGEPCSQGLVVVIQDTFDCLGEMLLPLKLNDIASANSELVAKLGGIPPQAKAYSAAWD